MSLLHPHPSKKKKKSRLIYCVFNSFINHSTCLNLIKILPEMIFPEADGLFGKLMWHTLISTKFRWAPTVCQPTPSLEGTQGSCVQFLALYPRGSEPCKRLSWELFRETGTKLRSSKLMRCRSRRHLSRGSWKFTYFSWEQKIKSKPGTECHLPCASYCSAGGTGTVKGLGFPYRAWTGRRGGIAGEARNSTRVVSLIPQNDSMKVGTVMIPSSQVRRASVSGFSTFPSKCSR